MLLAFALFRFTGCGDSGLALAWRNRLMHGDRVSWGKRLLATFDHDVGEEFVELLGFFAIRSLAAVPEKMPRSIQRGPSTPTMRVSTVLPPDTSTGRRISVPNTPSTALAFGLAARKSSRQSSHSPMVLGAA